MKNYTLCGKMNSSTNLIGLIIGGIILVLSVLLVIRKDNCIAEDE